MGKLINGAWHKQPYRTDPQGRFIRNTTQFRDRITADGSSGFAATTCTPPTRARGPTAC